MFAVFQTDEEKEADKKRSDKFNTWLGETLEERKKKKEAEGVKGKENKSKKERINEVKEKKEKKLEKHKHEVEKLINDLHRTIAAIKSAHEVLPGDETEAKNWVHKAKRYMARAKDSSALEDLAEDTPYNDHAGYLRSHVVGARTALDNINIDKQELIKFNQELGAIIKHIKELAEKIYGHLNLIGQVEQQKKKVQKSGGATGARRVGRIKPIR
ncbi:hypothetical protein HN918_02155 [archaeon]|nr:hypothetical protein [archaeon]MBT7192767.1 hypothetical protein [archaeon]